MQPKTTITPTPRRWGLGSDASGRVIELVNHGILRSQHWAHPIRGETINDSVFVAGLKGPRS